MQAMKSSVERGSFLDYLTVYPDDYPVDKAYPLIILLHGFGANKEDLSGLAPVIDRTGYLYVLPDAPLAAADDSTVRAWYERGGKESPVAVQEALAALDGFLGEISARLQVPAGRMLLAGFSQGGALSLRYGLPHPDRFAGIAVLSGSLRRVNDLLADLPPERKQPIFVSHGRHDELVPVEWSQDLVAFLEAQGYQPTYRTYPMGHEISPALVGDLRSWIRTVLPPCSADR
jgi:phospholipase/carboxylesterase